VKGQTTKRCSTGAKLWNELVRLNRFTTVTSIGVRRLNVMSGTTFQKAVENLSAKHDRTDVRPMDHSGAGAEDASSGGVLGGLRHMFTKVCVDLVQQKAASKKTAIGVGQEEEAAKVDDLQSQLQSIDADVRSGKLPKAPSSSPAASAAPTSTGPSARSSSRKSQMASALEARQENSRAMREEMRQQREALAQSRAVREKRLAEETLAREKSRAARDVVESRRVSAEEKSAEAQLVAARAAEKQAANVGTMMQQNSAVMMQMMAMLQKNQKDT